MADDSRHSGERGSQRVSAGLSGAEFAGLGLQFALAILLFTFAGVWLDGRLHSSPWFTIIGVFLGAGGGLYSMYRKVTTAQRLDAERRAANRR